MQIFKNRPLALSLFVFTLSAIFSYKLTPALKSFLLIFFVLLMVSGLSMIILRKTSGKYLSIFVLCSFFASIALFQSLFHFQFLTKPFREKEGSVITVEGYVTDVLNSGGNESRYAVRLQEADGAYSNAKILLECSYHAALQRGDSFRLSGTVRMPKNTPQYSEETILLSDGYLGILTCDDYRACTVFDEKIINFSIKMLELRDWLSERFKMTLNRETSAIASALFLGDRSDLSGDVILNFKRGGVSHLLALSGMHISVVILMWEILLRKLRIPKQCRAFIVPAIAICYLFLTGCASSTLRAVLMLCIMYLSYLFSADYDPFTSLCVALFMILTVSPHAVIDISMWMSFIASMGILIFVPSVSGWMEERLHKSDLPKWCKSTIRTIVTAVVVGLFANAAMLPFLSYFFGETSLFSVGLTLILSPLLSLALPLCALCLLFPRFHPIVWITQKSLGLFLFITDRAGNARNGLVLLNGRLTIALTVVLTILLILFSIVRLHKKGWLLLPVALSFVILGVSVTDSLPKDRGVLLSYLRSGQDEMLVLTEARTAIAIDFSDGNGITSKQISEALYHSKCTELEVLILTHYHPQATRLIASLSSDIKIRTVRLPIPNCEKEQAVAMRLEQEAELHGIDVVYGMEDLPIHAVQIQQLDRRSTNDVIEVPVLLSMTVSENRLVYLGGDVWNGGKRTLAENFAISADCLILGAHGTSTVPSESFFDGLNPNKIVIFGNESLFLSCPLDKRTFQFATEVDYKAFYLK